MNKTINSYDYLVIIGMIYLTIDFSSMVYSYKIIETGYFFGAASSLIFPLTYSIMDVIAEVYNFRIAKNILIYACVCDFIFATLVFLVSRIPSSNQSETLAYILVLGPLLRAVIAQTVGVLTGGLINAYLISRWKIMMNGRYFWLRSIGSSTIGEMVALVLSVFISLAEVLSLSKLFYLIGYAYLYKIIFAIIASPFVSLAVAFLKNKVKKINSDVNFNYLSIPSKLDFLSSSRQL